MSLGYNGLLADIYWTRAVQYYGNKHHERRPAVMICWRRCLEITTTLDPHLLVAYEYGANFLAPKPPNGAGMPERAIAAGGIRHPQQSRRRGGFTTTMDSSTTWS